MKKIFLIVFSIFILTESVNATTYINTYYTVTNKCAVVKDGKAVIPVTIRAGHDRVKLSNLIKDNRLGYVDNYENVLDLNIYGVSNDNMDILVDYKRDSQGRSLILLNVDENIELKTHDELISFNIEVNILNDAIINKINVLDNEIVLSDEKSCESINGFNVTEVEIIKYVDLSESDHKEYFKDLFTKVTIVILGISLIICIILLIKRKAG